MTFDDGVTQDRQTNISEGVMLVGAGLLSRFTFLTDRKYGQGLTEGEAREELERIREENRTDAAGATAPPRWRESLTRGPHPSFASQMPPSP